MAGFLQNVRQLLSARSKLRKVFDKTKRAQSLQELKDDYEELKQELAKLEADSGKDGQNEQLEKMRRWKKQFD